MPVKKILVTQTGNDVFTSVLIDTNLTVEGKSGWSINGITCNWKDVAGVAAADWRLDAKLSTDGTDTLFIEDEELARVSWAVQNTGGIAVALPVEPIKSVLITEPRVTVQPQIAACVSSSLTGNANDVEFMIFYDIVKLSDLEVLRLLQGGA